MSGRGGFQLVRVAPSFVALLALGAASCEAAYLEIERAGGAPAGEPLCVGEGAELEVSLHGGCGGTCPPEPFTITEIDVAPPEALSLVAVEDAADHHKRLSVGAEAAGTAVISIAGSATEESWSARSELELVVEACDQE